MKKPAAASFVYFIEAADSCAIKIGVSVNVENRLKALQISHPHRLRILLAVDGDRLVEHHLHFRFHSERLNGEWFVGNGELRKFIARLLEMTPEDRAKEAAASYPSLEEPISQEELERTWSDFEEMQDACFKVIRETGIEETAAALTRIWGPKGRGVLPSTVSGVLEGKFYLRAEWLWWFGRKSRDVAECLYRMRGPEAREYVALCRVIRAELGEEAGEALIQRARAR